MKKLLFKYAPTAITALGLIVVLLFSTIATAQIPTCTEGCTSKDIKIVRGFLTYNAPGEPNHGVEINQSFNCNSGETISAKLNVILNTSTPRKGLTLYGYLKEGAVLTAIGECFPVEFTKDLQTVTVTFTQPVTWTCGANVELKDIVIAWGTGNSQWCIGDAAQCPGTSSKCWKQGPTEYIPIVNFPCSNPTITAQPGNQQKCAGQSASFSFTFNQGSPEATIQWQVKPMNGVWSNLTNSAPYSGVNTTTLNISTTTVAMNGNQYKAVLTNNTENNQCGAETNGNATLTVYAIPPAPGVSVQNNCDGTSMLTATGFTGSLLWSTGATSTSITVNTPGTRTVTQTVNGCTSPSGSGTAAPGLAPTVPSVTYNAPTCDATTFSVTVTGVVQGVTYTIKDKNGANIAGVSPGNSVVAPNTNNITFSNIPAGAGYKVTATSGTCSSSANECGGGAAPPQEKTQSASREVLIEMPGDDPVVQVFPNPFRTAVTFKLVSPVSGRASLDVYNASGQRIGNAFNGVLQANVPVTSEFHLATPTPGMLFYRMVMDGRSATGKLISIR